jgi:hypothetical protein
MSSQPSGCTGTTPRFPCWPRARPTQAVERVAERLGESADFIHDVALEMDTEDGVIWVYGIGDDGVLAFTDFGIETLVELIGIHKDLKSRAGV